MIAMEIKERMRAVLAAEAAAISRVQVDDNFERAVRTLQHCEGKVLTTGIGKAGHIARKFAATLCSTATPADFIHPAEAAHGDLGLVDNHDVLIAFSTSGKSREVLEILELARHLGVATIDQCHLRRPLLAGGAKFGTNAAQQLQFELVDHQLEQCHLAVARRNDAQQFVDVLGGLMGRRHGFEYA